MISQVSQLILFFPFMRLWEFWKLILEPFSESLQIPKSISPGWWEAIMGTFSTLHYSQLRSLRGYCIWLVWECIEVRIACHEKQTINWTSPSLPQPSRQLSWAKNSRLVVVAFARTLKHMISNDLVENFLRTFLYSSHNMVPSILWYLAAGSIPVEDQGDACTIRCVIDDKFKPGSLSLGLGRSNNSNQPPWNSYKRPGIHWRDICRSFQEARQI